jgi:hypothetical protein
VGAVELDQTDDGVHTYTKEPRHIIRNNIIHHIIASGIRAGTSSQVYNNVVYDCSQYGILVDNPAADSWTRTIYHNTVDMNATIAIKLSGGTAVVKNNIGPSSSGNIGSSSGFYKNTLAGSENYHLVSGSAPINTGVDLRFAVPTDIEGNPRDDHPDMGAYEFTGAKTLSGHSKQTGFNIKLQNASNSRSIRIVIQLSEPLHLTLGLFDIQSRFIKTIADGWFLSGKHVFNAPMTGKNTISSGAYIINGAVGNKKIQEKIIML